MYYKSLWRCTGIRRKTQACSSVAVKPLIKLKSLWNERQLRILPSLLIFQELLRAAVPCGCSLSLGESGGCSAHPVCCHCQGQGCPAQPDTTWARPGAPAPCSSSPQPKSCIGVRGRQNPPDWDLLWLYNSLQRVVALCVQFCAGGGWVYGNLETTEAFLL